MASLNHFDANQVEPSTGRDPIPTGKYVVVITDSQMKSARSGAGQFLEMTYQIVDGEHKGRKVWSRHNLQHSHPQVVSIARGELSSICRAIGVMQPKDSSELHGLPLAITVKVKRRDDTQELRNEVVGWTGKGAAAGIPQQAGAAGGPATPPWLRKG